MMLVVDMRPTIIVTTSGMVPAITVAGVCMQKSSLVAGKPRSHSAPTAFHCHFTVSNVCSSSSSSQAASCVCKLLLSTETTKWPNFSRAFGARGRCAALEAYPRRPGGRKSAKMPGRALSMHLRVRVIR